MEKLKMIMGSKDRAEEVKVMLEKWGAVKNSMWMFDFCDEELLFCVDPIDKNVKAFRKSGGLLNYLNYEVVELPEKTKWRDNKSVKVSGYRIADNDSSIEYFSGLSNIYRNYNVFATKKQAKSALAMAQISQIMANDERFGGVVTDEEWKNDIERFSILRLCDDIIPDYTHREYQFLAFHTREQRDLFLVENGDLVKDYFMLD